MIRSALIAALLTFGPIVAGADTTIKALKDRGFLPAPSIYLNKFTYHRQTAATGLPLGVGYVVRLPEPLKVQQVLAVVGGRSVILDVIEEPGTFNLSPEAIEALGLLSSGNEIKKADIDIVALMRLTHQLRPAVSNETFRPSAFQSTTGPKTAPIPIAAPRSTAGSASTGIMITFEPSEGEKSRPLVELEWFTTQAPENWPGEGGVKTSPSAEASAFQEYTDHENLRIPAPPIKPRVPSAFGRSAQFAEVAASKQLVLQVGYFKKEENAKRLAESLEDRSLPVQILERRSADGGPGWRVFAGPFANQSEIDQARAQGGRLLEDAYPVWMPLG